MNNSKITWDQFAASLVPSSHSKVWFLNKDVKERVESSKEAAFYLWTNKLMWEADPLGYKNGLTTSQFVHNRVAQQVKNAPTVTKIRPAIITDVMFLPITAAEAANKIDEKCLDWICKNYGLAIKRLGPEYASYLEGHDPMSLFREAIQEIRNPNDGRIKFSLWEPNYRDLEKVDSLFNSGHKTILAELCPRYRKTSWTLAGFLISDKDVLVVMSYVLSALTSYKNDVGKFDIFEDIECVDTRDLDWEQRVKDALAIGKKVVICVSLHHNTPEKKQELACIKTLNRRCVVDEADWGAWREKQVDLVKYIVDEEQLLIETGTNEARAGTFFKPDARINTTFLDLLAAKENAPKEYHSALGFKYNPVIDLPTPEFYQLRYPTFVSERQNPSFRNICSDPMKSLGNLTTLIGSLLAGESDDYDHLALENVLKRDPRHIAWWWPENTTIENIDKLTKIMQNIATSCNANYRCVPLHGKVTSSDNCESYADDIITEAEMNGERVILNMMKLGARSFSEGRLYTTVLAYDNGSAHQSLQKIMRVLTTHSENPEKIPAIITIGFNTTRADILDPPIIVTAVKYAEDHNVDFETAIMIVVRSLKIKRMDDNGVCLTIEADDYARKLLSINSLTKLIAKTADIQVILNDDEMVEKLLGVTAQVRSIGTSDQVMDLGKTFLDKNGKLKERKKVSQKTEQEREIYNLLYKIQLAIAALTDSMKLVAYMSEKTTTIDILTDMAEDIEKRNLFNDEFGVEPEFVRNLITRGVLSDHLVNAALMVQRRDDHDHEQLIKSKYS